MQGGIVARRRFLPLVEMTTVFLFDYQYVTQGLLQSLRHEEFISASDMQEGTGRQHPNR